MTDFTELSDTELSEALEFHRRQRNLSRGVNESANMRQAQIVRILEAEEARRLDELSKKTLSSYVKKAGTDQYLKGQAVQYHTNKAQSADGPFSKETKAKHYDAADKALKKASNRDTGIGRAADRLAKEEVEQIDELSPKTLHSYIDKADKHMDKLDRTIRKSDETMRQSDMARHKLGGAARKADDAQSEKTRRSADTEYGRAQRKVATTSSAADEARKIKSAAQRKMDKRYTGVERAHDRLGEEVEQIDEVSTEKLRDYASAALQDKNKAKADKRWKYAGKAMDKVAGREVKAAHALKYNKMEEVEQIDELSKKTLGSYIRRSAVDVYRTGQNVEAHLNARNATDNYAKQRRHAELTDKARLKASNRITGIERATHKMAKEEVKLDEESKLRVTKVYNKWPKPATYAVHNNDRSYHKEFDSMEAAQAHKDEKSK